MIETTGKFWSTEAPDRSVAGRLVIDQDGASVHLLDELVAFDAPEAVTVHGITSEQGRVSLVQCIPIHHRTIGGGAHVEQTLSVRYAVLGAHISGPEQKYTAVAIRADGLDAWANLEWLSYIPGDDDPGELLRIQRKESSPLTRVGEFSISIGGVIHNRRNLSSYAIEHEAWISIDQFVPRTFDEVDRDFIAPVTGVISLLTGTACPLLNMELLPDGADSQHPLSRVVAKDEVPRSRTVRPHDVLVPHGATSLMVLANFLSRNRLLGSLTPVIADAQGEPARSSIQTQLLQLTTVAEGLHRRLFPEEFRLVSADVLDIKAKISTALAENPQRHLDILNGFLAHVGEPNYKNRLRRLVNEVSVIMPGVAGQVPRWINKVDHARNTFAHSLGTHLDAPLAREYYVICRSLVWIMSGVLLKDSGVRENLLRDRIAQSRPYQHFLRQAHTLLPTIYLARQ
jgi:hypothetical protein